MHTSALPLRARKQTLQVYDGNTNVGKAACCKMQAKSHFARSATLQLVMFNTQTSSTLIEALEAGVRLL